jgi:hypothetical protein
MLGISSLKEMHEWATEQFGPVVAKVLSSLILLGLVGVAIAGIGVGVSWLIPPIQALWSLLPGTPEVGVNWVDAVAGSAGGVAVAAASTWIAGKLRELGRQSDQLARTVNIIRGWLAGALEERLKTLENTAATVDSVTDAHQSVQEQLAALTKRVRELESHTDIDGFVKMLAEQAFQADGALKTEYVEGSYKLNTRLRTGEVRMGALIDLLNLGAQKKDAE